MLGPIEVTQDGGRPRPISSPNQRIVLATLALEPGRTVSTDALMDAIWSDDVPDSGLQTLRSYVSRLRAELGKALVSTSGGYSLTIDPLDTDAGRFEALIEAAPGQHPERAVEIFTAALDLWRGEPLANTGDGLAMSAHRRRLEGLHAHAVEQLALAHVMVGRPESAVAPMEQLTTAEPVREQAWAVLARAHIGAGRPTDAVRAVAAARVALSEAGLEPSPLLLQVEADAFAGTSAPGGDQSPARTVATATSSLVGREQDLAHVVELLDEARIVTLLGPGGVGKTRLSHAVVDERIDNHRQGVRMVELGSIVTGAAVALAVVDGLGLSAEGHSAMDALSSAGSLDMLVVLDNCEHVIEEVALVVDAMVRGGPAVRVLTTSRERIGVDGEHAHPVRPLDAVGDNPPGRELFIQRARAAAPDVEITIADRSTIDRIVRRVDGLPLAIEMAAAQLTSMGLDELAELLEHHLGTLRSTKRTGDARHRTLGAVIEWSEALLAAGEKEVLAQMSVFADAVGRYDIDAVLGSSQASRSAASLADRSLLVVDRTMPTTRYRMLETVKHHASARLEDGQNLAARHANHFASVLEDIDSDLRSTREPLAVDRLSATTREIRRSMRWAIDNDLALGARIVADHHLAAHNQLLDQPLAWADYILPRLEGTEPRYDGVLAAAAERAVNAGNLEEAESLARRACSVENPRPSSLELLGDIQLYLGDFDDAIATSARLVEIAEETDEHATVTGRVNLALANHYAGNDDEATRWLMDASAFGPSPRGWMEYTCGEVNLTTDPAAAIEHLRTAIELADSIKNRFLGGVARVSIASVLAVDGEEADAIEAFRSIVSRWREQGARTHLLPTLRHLVVLLARVGRMSAAAELLGAVSRDNLRDSYGEEAERVAAAAERIGTALGSDRFEELVSIGTNRGLDEAADAALVALASTPAR